MILKLIVYFFLKKLKIDFNQIIIITLNLYKTNGFCDKFYFSKTLFSFNIENNLIYLNIKYLYDYQIAPKSFEKINKFKSLNYLYIKFFNFESQFVVSLDILKLLSIIDCNNATIDKKCLKVWKYLIILIIIMILNLLLKNEKKVILKI